MCRCYERIKLKLEDLKASNTLGGVGEGDPLRRAWRGKKIGYERFESVRGECSSVKIQDRHL